MPLDADEAATVAQAIAADFDRIAAAYDFTKYPADDYRRFRERFASLACDNPEIRPALLWKWGHGNKSNFPAAHRDLIDKIESLWPLFVRSDATAHSARTFEWWYNALNPQSVYITVAYLTHLVHHREPLPIIDQHNFRAMNALVRLVQPSYKFKQKPSRWSDILELKSFMLTLLPLLDCEGFGDLDRFLMSLGKRLKTQPLTALLSASATSLERPPKRMDYPASLPPLIDIHFPVGSDTPGHPDLQFELTAFFGPAAKLVGAGAGLEGTELTFLLAANESPAAWTTRLLDFLRAHGVRRGAWIDVFPEGRDAGSPSQRIEVPAAH